MKNKIKVIYIAGSGRSGSTLLERLMSQNNDIFGAGELKSIFNRGFKQNQLCGCKKKFHDCSIWNKIINDSSLGDVDSIISLLSDYSNRLSKVWYTHYILLGYKRKYLKKTTYK